MSEPQPIPTHRNQALIDVEAAHTYFVACFKKDEDGEDVFCGYVSALGFAERRKLWGAVSQWLVHDQIKLSLDNGWMEE